MFNKLLYPALFLLFVSSCSSVYIPSVPNTPLLTEKGQFKGGIHGSLNKNININAAYALSPYFAFIGNHNSMHIERDKKDVKHRSVELGAGYFGKIGKSKNQIFEVYAGFGRASNDRLLYIEEPSKQFVLNRTEKASYDKKFIQVNYSSKKEDNLKLFNRKFDLNFGTAIRFSFVKTDDLLIDGIKQANEDNIFFEPIFFTTLGITDQIKLQYTNGSNIGLKSRDFLNANNSIFSLGIIFNFQPKVK